MIAHDNTVHKPPCVVLLAGGSGRRFWPFTRSEKKNAYHNEQEKNGSSKEKSASDLPKQFLSLFGDSRTFLEITFDRALSIAPPSNIYILSHKAYEEIMSTMLPQMKKENFIWEPRQKNTGPAIIYALHELKKRNLSDETIIIFLPADHWIGGDGVDGVDGVNGVDGVDGGDGDGEDTQRGEGGEGFRPRETSSFTSWTATLHKGIEFLSSPQRTFHPFQCLLIGFTPSFPHTGYGYIEYEVGQGSPSSLSNPYPVKGFKEKPDLATAQSYIAQKNYLWNSGIFLGTLGGFIDLITSSIHFENAVEYNQGLFDSLPAQSFDELILEKNPTHLAVVKAHFPWSDVGSWESVYSIFYEREQKKYSDETAAFASSYGHVIVSGQVQSIESDSCLIHVGEGKKIALVGVRDLVIIEKENRILICNKKSAQKVKEIDL